MDMTSQDISWNGLDEKYKKTIQKYYKEGINLVLSKESDSMDPKHWHIMTMLLCFIENEYGLGNLES